MQNKINTITNLFEGKEIGSVWDSKREDYYFSVVDVVGALTNSPNPRKYWSVLKIRLKKEGSQVTTNCSQLKMIAPDGKIRMRDVLDTEGIFRLIESIPSPKAEPFKLWLAKLGREKVDEVFDPSKGIDQMIDFYLSKGYSLEWIEKRIKAIVNRKKLTTTWKDHGIKENYEYAILTNEIYKNWSGMTASEYKEYKNIRKENLRDNMSDIEVALTDIGEIATRELVRKHKPANLKDNKRLAQLGGHAAKVAREDLEKNLGEAVITSKNNLNYQYINDKIKLH
ncbi:MAG: phage antirepressor protein [Bacilli bacterium]|nr:phage antirepressor protein [Bacilli bacterium]